jgi:hypothetical protein
MNLPLLARLLADLQKSLTAVDEELKKVKSEVDPFARHVFQARRSYARVDATDGKGGKRIQREVWDSYRQATALGFQGGEREWKLVLSAYPPPPKNASSEQHLPD